DDVLRKMMALDPKDRYQTPGEVMQALLPFLNPGSLLDTPRSHGLGGLGAMMRGHSGMVLGAKTHRVLLVDDESSIRMFCREVLRVDGLACEEASNGEEGYQKAMTLEPDLMLVDINMPGMTGPELLRRIRTNP